MVVLAFFGSRRKILALFISSGRMTSAFFFFGGNISEPSILNVWVCVQGVVSLREITCSQVTVNTILAKEEVLVLTFCSWRTTTLALGLSAYPIFQFRKVVISFLDNVTANSTSPSSTILLTIQVAVDACASSGDARDCDG